MALKAQRSIQYYDADGKLSTMIIAQVKEITPQTPLLKEYDGDSGRRLTALSKLVDANKWSDYLNESWSKGWSPTYHLGSKLYCFEEAGVKISNSLPIRQNAVGLMPIVDLKP